MIDFDRIWDYVTDRFELGAFSSIHGYEHWRNVEKNALTLARDTGADEEFIRLFAILHDSCRENEDEDPDHGARAAELAKELRGEYFDLSDDQFANLCSAMVEHDKGKRSADPNIGTCWDADRLDLGRVGEVPLPSFMSTEAGRRQCIKRMSEQFGHKHGSTGP